MRSPVTIPIARHDADRRAHQVDSARRRMALEHLRHLRELAAGDLDARLLRALAQALARSPPASPRRPARPRRSRPSRSARRRRRRGRSRSSRRSRCRPCRSGSPLGDDQLGADAVGADRDRRSARPAPARSRSGPTATIERLRPPGVDPRTARDDAARRDRRPRASPVSTPARRVRVAHAAPPRRARTARPPPTRGAVGGVRHAASGCARAS